MWVKGFIFRIGSYKGVTVEEEIILKHITKFLKQTNKEKREGLK